MKIAGGANHWLSAGGDRRAAEPSSPGDDHGAVVHLYLPAVESTAAGVA